MLHRSPESELTNSRRREKRHWPGTSTSPPPLPPPAPSICISIVRGGHWPGGERGRWPPPANSRVGWTLESGQQRSVNGDHVPVCGSVL